MTGAAKGTLPSGVTFVVCHRIGLLTAEPYVQALRDRSVCVYVVCPAEIRAEVLTRTSLTADYVLDLGELAKRTGMCGRLHGWLTAFLSKQTTYSRGRARWRVWGRNPTIKERLRGAAAHLGPKLNARTLNVLMRWLLGRWSSGQLPTKTVVAVSHVTEPQLLCARELRVATLVESWDHPVKKTAGYPSALVIGWNHAITADRSCYQGADRAVVGYPIKLRYADASRGSLTPPPDSRKVAMYAVGTSARHATWFRDELAVIEELCRGAAEAGWRLHLKPKPNGVAGELDDFERRYPHVSVGQYGHAVSPLGYYLDAAYNQTRLKELQQCSLVINCWTTFALDAACAGWPVLQLDLTGSHAYPELAAGLRNYHLASYLLGTRSLCLYQGPDEKLASSISAYLCAPDGRAELFGEKLRQWVLPQGAYEERVGQAVDAILALDLHGAAQPTLNDESADAATRGARAERAWQPLSSGALR